MRQSSHVSCSFLVKKTTGQQGEQGQLQFSHLSLFSCSLFNEKTVRRLGQSEANGWWCRRESSDPRVRIVRIPPPMRTHTHPPCERSARPACACAWGVWGVTHDADFQTQTATERVRIPPTNPTNQPKGQF